MSNQEFEVYLNLLTRLLRIPPTQREAISCELRDHLEARVSDLIEEGTPEEEAVKLALDELGDASGLATQFTSITRITRRRIIMRWSVSSAMALGLVALLGLHLLTPAGIPDRIALAQPGAGGAPGVQPADANPNTYRDKIENALNMRIDAEFVEVPFRDVLGFLRDRLEINILVNEKYLTDLGVSMETPVTLQLKDVSARSVLKLILRQISADDIGYAIEDNVLLLTEQASAYEVKVFNCLDLINQLGLNGMGMPAGFGEMVPGGGEGGAAFNVQLGPGGGGPPGGMMGGMPGGAPPQLVQHSPLVGAILTTIEGPWEDVDGDGGSIAEVRGLLIVRHNNEVIKDVENLLAMMRRSLREGPGGVGPGFGPPGVGVPGSTVPGSFPGAPGGGSGQPSTTPGVSGAETGAPPVESGRGSSPDAPK